MGRKFQTLSSPPADEFASGAAGHSADANDGDAGAGSEVGTPTRPWFPQVMIGLAIVVVLIAATMMYLQWYHVRFPTSYLFPYLPENTTALAGTEFIVRDENDNRVVARVRLTQQNNFSAPVLVEPDVVYVISARLDDQVLLEPTPVRVAHRRGVQIPLTSRPSAPAQSTGRTTAPVERTRGPG